MAKTVSSGLNLAAKEHLLEGNPLTRLEAIVLFGVSNLPELVYEMRKDGYIVKSTKIPYVKAVVRINKVAHLTPPKNLSIREIMLTEYRVKR